MRGNFSISRSVLALVLLSSGVAWGKDVRIIAHRGASSEAPENTRAAIVRAIELEAPVIEFDVRATSDGELVLFHDDTLERTGGRKGSIETSRWEDLAGLDVGRWFGDGTFAGERPMRLVEALDLCAEHDVVALVEHKSGPASIYARVIRDLDRPDGVIVQSFDWEFLAEFRSAMPGIPIGALGSKTLKQDRFTRLEKLAPDWVGWKHSDLGVSSFERIREELDCRVALWTVNDPKDARTWIERGAHGIITDRPGEMRRLLDE